MNVKLIAGASAVAVAYVSRVYTNTVREERAKRAEIERNRKRELLAINAATATMLERMKHVRYANAEQLLADLEFEMIREYNKD